MKGITMTEPVVAKPTADLVDEYGKDLRVSTLQMRDFGGNKSFAGPIATIRCHLDNGLVKATLNSPGEGRVLVIDGEGDLSTALCGDLIAGAAVKNNWAGIIVNGAIRDSAAIGALPLGCKALGTTPAKSAKDSAGEKDIPLSFGGIIWKPGDILHADLDGVVLLPEN